MVLKCPFLKGKVGEKLDVKMGIIVYCFVDFLKIHKKIDI